MGFLPQAKIEKLVLPSTKDKPEVEQEWVEVNTNPLGGDVLEAIGDSATTAAEKTYVMLARIVKSWSYTNPDGTPADINPENLASLNFQDLNFLAEFINPLLSAIPGGDGQEKKSSSPSESTSSPNGRAAG